ncbi:MAG: amidohydrolase [Fervidobacterium sp.]
MVILIIKNAWVWNGMFFEKRDLFIKDGKFVRKSDYTENGPVVNATGLFLMPGFIDSHAHVVGTGMKILTHDLVKEKLEDVLKSSEEFIIARGWENVPDNQTVNFANSLSKPVFLIRKCGHVAFVNNFLKSKLNLSDNFIYESQLDKVWNFLGDEFYQKAFEYGQMEFLKHGVTQVHSDDFHGISFKLLKNLLNNSKIRVFEKLCTNEPWNYEFGNFGISKIGGIKIYADGSLGGRTAYMFESYLDNGTNGLFTIPENMNEIITYAENNGLQLNIHTIGDRAVHEVIEILTKNTLKRRHRLIHVQFIRKQDFEKLKSFYISVQPHFYFEDLDMLKHVRCDLAYPFFEMYNAGFEVAFSTDSPVSPADPKYVIEHALKMGFSRSDAIHLYTEAGAKMSKFNAGKIEEGYLADFCLYASDPFENDPIQTFVNGELVFEKGKIT